MWMVLAAALAWAQHGRKENDIGDGQAQHFGSLDRDIWLNRLGVRHSCVLFRSPMIGAVDTVRTGRHSPLPADGRLPIHMRLCYGTAKSVTLGGFCGPVAQLDRAAVS